MDHRVSIIIPTYNRAHFLPECLDALLGQTVPASEIIVVNDGSTDSTIEALIPYRDKIVYLEKPNGGKASALNMGLAHATGDFIWIFDDDDISLPDAMETHLNVFANNPWVDFTYSGYHVGVFDTEARSLRIIETFKPFIGEGKSLFISFALGAFGPGIGFMFQQGMLVRKRCYDILEPFDESLSRSEDLDMNLRLCLSFRGLRIDCPTFIFRRHEGVRGPSYDLYSYAEREKKLWESDRKVFRKLYETADLSKYLDEQVSDEKKNRQGRSLANRATVMAKWNLDDLVIKDITELIRLVGNKEVILDETTLRQILYIEALCQRKDRRELANSLHTAIKGLIKAGAGRDLRVLLAKYYYWKGIENYKKGKRTEFFRGVWRALDVGI